MESARQHQKAGLLLLILYSCMCYVLIHPDGADSASTSMAYNQYPYGQNGQQRPYGPPRKQEEGNPDVNEGQGTVNGKPRTNFSELFKSWAQLTPEQQEKVDRHNDVVTGIFDSINESINGIFKVVSDVIASYEQFLVHLHDKVHINGTTH